MVKEDRMNLLKYILAGAIGFGIGGAIWGLSIPTTEHYAIPFTYTIGGIALGSIGGASLALFSKDIKKILKFALFGVIGFFIGFIIGIMLSYHFFFLGRGFITMLLILTSNPDKWEVIFELKPSLAVGHLVFDFAVVGAIGGLFYGVALKKRIIASSVAGMLGFGIGSLIGPIIGNMVEMVSGSLLAAYVTTFMIIGVILGAFLGRCVYLAEKPPTNSKEEMGE
jgi:hypothetical protein